MTKKTPEKIPPKLPRNMTRLRDDEYVDEIRIKLMPRYKESEMSGDEWRAGAHVDFLRKGHVVHENHFLNVSTAALALPWHLAIWNEDGKDDHRMPDDRYLCHQPGCPNQASSIKRLKKRFSREGFQGEARDEFRAFCKTHDRRGNAGLEDSDANYEAYATLETSADGPTWVVMSKDGIAAPGDSNPVDTGPTESSPFEAGST